MQKKNLRETQTAGRPAHNMKFLKHGTEGNDRFLLETSRPKNKHLTNNNNSSKLCRVVVLQKRCPQLLKIYNKCKFGSFPK